MAESNRWIVLAFLGAENEAGEVLALNVSCAEAYRIRDEWNEPHGSPTPAVILPPSIRDRLEKAEDDGRYLDFLDSQVAGIDDCIPFGGETVK